jgi:hypothetical protein
MTAATRRGRRSAVRPTSCEQAHRGPCPSSPIGRHPDGTLLVTTSLAFAQKAGPASLLVHRHDNQLNGLRNVLLRGELTGGTDGWLLRPQRLVDPGATSTLREVVGTLRAARRRTATYLDRRGIAAPPVRWREFRQVAATVPTHR